MRKIKKQIVIHAFTPIAKPINASIQKNSSMLLLGKLPYTNSSKTFNTKFYYIKGIRGMLRHVWSLLKTATLKSVTVLRKQRLKMVKVFFRKGFMRLVHVILPVFSEQSLAPSAKSPLLLSLQILLSRLNIRNTQLKCLFKMSTSLAKIG